MLGLKRKKNERDRKNLVIEQLCGLQLSPVTIRLMDEVEGLRRVCRVVRIFVQN
jgi:hypothetical protein